MLILMYFVQNLPICQFWYLWWFLLWLVGTMNAEVTNGTSLKWRDLLWGLRGDNKRNVRKRVWKENELVLVGFCQKEGQGKRQPNLTGKRYCLKKSSGKMAWIADAYTTVMSFLKAEQEERGFHVIYYVSISLVQFWNCFLAIKVPFSDFPPSDKHLKGNSFNLVTANHSTT